MLVRYSNAQFRAKLSEIALENWQNYQVFSILEIIR
jgi:hypothetical protein